MKTYPAYKHSGVSWLGDVPLHWRTKRLKYLVKINALTLPENTNPELEISYIDIGGVDANGNISTAEQMTFEEAPSRARRIVTSGDVLVSTVRTYLKAIAFVEDTEPDLICSTGFAVLTAENNLVPKFLFYWTRSQEFVDQVVSRSVGVSYPAINAAEIGNIEAPLLSIEEQQAIVAFLDRKTARIDAVIREKERQISLLQEKRQALISHAVTRGLNPDAPLRPSGIGWLGDIPAHWKTLPIKFMSVSLQTGPFGSQLHSQDYIDDGTPIVNPANIEAGRIVPNMLCTVDVDTYERLRHHALQVGDVVIGRRGEMGRCAVVTLREENWLCGTGSLRMRFFKRLCCPEYIGLQLSLRGMKDWLTLTSVGSTMDNLNTEILGRVPVCLPPMEEQQAIVDHLNRETANIDGIMQTVETQIARLREYRQALISDAVTGKTNVQAQENAETFPVLAAGGE